MANLVAKSALHSAYQPGDYTEGDQQAIRIQEIRGLSMLNLFVWDDSVASIRGLSNLQLPSVGSAQSHQETRLLWIGPQRYLLVKQQATPMTKGLTEIPASEAVITDLSCARSVIRIKGEATRAVLAKGLAVDLDAESFKANQVILSSFDHHFPAIIHNISDQQTAYDIYIARSYALSFWQWLCDASLEFGYQIQPAQVFK